MTLYVYHTPLYHQGHRSSPRLLSGSESVCLIVNCANSEIYIGIKLLIRITGEGEGKHKGSRGRYFNDTFYAFTTVCGTHWSLKQTYSRDSLQYLVLILSLALVQLTRTILRNTQEDSSRTDLYFGVLRGFSVTFHNTSSRPDDH